MAEHGRYVQIPMLLLIGFFFGFIMGSYLFDSMEV